MVWRVTFSYSNESNSNNAFMLLLKNGVLIFVTHHAIATDKPIGDMQSDIIFGLLGAPTK